MNKDSTRAGALSMKSLGPQARKDADVEREEAERKGVNIGDARKRRRKGRTEPLSLRVHPHIKKALIDMADAEDCDLVVIVEDAIERRHKAMRGQR